MPFSLCRSHRLFHAGILQRVSAEAFRCRFAGRLPLFFHAALRYGARPAFRSGNMRRQNVRAPSAIHPPPCLPQRCQQVESPTSFCSWMSASSSPAPAQTGPASGCRHPPMPSNEGTPPFRRQNAAPTPKDEDGVRILQTGNIPRPRIIPSAATDGKAARPKDRTRALRPQIGEAFTL